MREDLGNFNPYEDQPHLFSFVCLVCSKITGFAHCGKVSVDIYD